MKTYTIIFTILLSLFTIMSCKNDDDTPTQQPQTHPIEGKWNLVFIQASFGGGTSFQPNDIIWEFGNENDVTRTNNIELTTPIMSIVYPYHISGTQHYQLDDEEDKVSFELDYMPEGQNLRVYPFRIEADTLTIGDYSASDGTRIYKFSKN